MIFNLIAPLIALVLVLACEIVKLPFKFTIFLIKSPFVLAERLFPSTEALIEVLIVTVEALFKVAKIFFQGLCFLFSKLIYLFPENSTRDAKVETLNCVYMGTDPSCGKRYIGQTTMFPEKRFLQHRRAMTGPFKGNVKNVRWDILKENISDADLDYWESYYIGYYDTFKNGFNSTRGNNYLAYKKGSR